MDKLYPVGTTYITRGKHPKDCMVTDIHVTYSLNDNRVVKTRYATQHRDSFGRVICENDVAHTTIAMGARYVPDTVPPCMDPLGVAIAALEEIASDDTEAYHVQIARGVLREIVWRDK